MRPLIKLLLLSPFLRTSLATTSARHVVPALAYPVCRRAFTCASPLQQLDTRATMSDVNGGAREEVERVAEPASLGSTKGTEEALKEEPALPKLSAADFKAYNSMAEHMDYFHNHFRQSWNLLYNACTANRRPASLTLKQFISSGLEFSRLLTFHHNMEEAHIFPVLAQKMPEFKNGRNAAELLRQHREIHAGMDHFEEYLKQCKNGETELELRVLKEKMDSWGTVLWTHLDQEVRTLGAENMRRYWTLEEMRRMPM